MRPRPFGRAFAVVSRRDPTRRKGRAPDAVEEAAHPRTNLTPRQTFRRNRYKLSYKRLCSRPSGHCSAATQRAEPEAMPRVGWQQRTLRWATTLTLVGRGRDPVATDPVQPSFARRFSHRRANETTKTTNRLVARKVDFLFHFLSFSSANASRLRAAANRRQACARSFTDPLPRNTCQSSRCS